MSRLVRALTLVGALVLAVMLLVTCMQVLLRYLVNRPTTWSEEGVLFLLVWFGFILLALGVYHKSHIRLEFCYQRFPPQWRRLVDVLRYLLVFALGVLMAYYAWQAAQLSWATKMPATQISRAFLYLSEVVGGGLVSLFALVRLVSVLRRRKGE